MIRVHIDTDGTITVDAEGDLAELTTAEEQSGTRVRLTVGNRSIAVPAPTGIRTDTSPYWGMLVFGVIALAAAAIPVIARKRRNWDE